MALSSVVAEAVLVVAEAVKAVLYNNNNKPLLNKVR
jgi:hypothetical protein